MQHKAQHYFVKTSIEGAAGAIAADIHVWLVKTEASTEGAELSALKPAIDYGCTVDFCFAPLQNRCMPEAAEQLTLEDGSCVQLYRAQKWSFGEISSSVDRLLIRSPQGQEIDCIIFQQHGKAIVKFVRKQLRFAKLNTSGLINTDFAYGLEEPPREWAELVMKIRKRFDSL
jgi:hypothetical protein